MKITVTPPVSGVSGAVELLALKVCRLSMFSAVPEMTRASAPVTVMVAVLVAVGVEGKGVS